MASHIKWNYAVESYAGEQIKTRMPADFARLGGLGFELVAVIAPVTGVIQCYFKRPAEEDFDFG